MRLYGHSSSSDERLNDLIGRAKHGRTLLQRGKMNLQSMLMRLKRALLHRPQKRLADPAFSMGELVADNDQLRVERVNNIGDADAQVLSNLIERMKRDRLILISSLHDFFQAMIGYVLASFCNRLLRSVQLPAAPVAAAAFAAVRFNRHVSHFARIAVCPLEQFPSDNRSGADAGPCTDIDEVLRLLACAVLPFANGACPSFIVDRDDRPGKPLLYSPLQLNVSPAQVRGEQNIAFFICV